MDSRSYTRTTKEEAALITNKKIITGEAIEIKRNIKLDLILWIVFGLLIMVPIGYITVKDIMNPNENPYGVIIGIGLIFLFAFAGYKNLTLERLRLPILLTTKKSQL